MNSPAKLTDTQFAILSEASQRKERCLIPPKTLKAAAAQKVATKLLQAGLVSEVNAKTGMEAWRRDKETGQAYSLKLTDAGLKAIAADERGSQSIPSTGVARIRTMICRKRRPQQIWRRPGAQRRRQQRRRPPRHEDRTRDRIAPTRSGRQVGRADRRHGLVAAYRASRADRPSPSRLRRPPGAWRNRPRPGLPRRRYSRGQRVIPNATEPEELDAAADQFGRRAAWTDRRRQPRPERLRGDERSRNRG